MKVFFKSPWAIQGGSSLPQLSSFPLPSCKFSSQDAHCLLLYDLRCFPPPHPRAPLPTRLSWLVGLTAREGRSGRRLLSHPPEGWRGRGIDPWHQSRRWPLQALGITATSSAPWLPVTLVHGHSGGQGHNKMATSEAFPLPPAAILQQWKCRKAQHTALQLLAVGV